MRFPHFLVGLIWLNIFWIFPGGISVETVSSWHQYEQGQTIYHQKIVQEKQETGLQVVNERDHSPFVDWQKFLRDEIGFHELVQSFPLKNQKIHHCFIAAIMAQAPPLSLA